jgi:hypothetical protein
VPGSWWCGGGCQAAGGGDEGDGADTRVHGDVVEGRAHTTVPEHLAGGGEDTKAVGLGVPPNVMSVSRQRPGRGWRTVVG